MAARVVAVIAAVLVVAAGSTALGLALWARSYEPLVESASFSPSHGNRGIRAVPSAYGPEGGLVSHYLLHPESLTVEYGVANEGRWSIDLNGIAAVPAAPGMFTVKRVVLNARSGRERALPARNWKVRIRPDHGAAVAITFQVRCAGQPRGTYSLPVVAMRLHYRYLHFFERSQDVPVHNLMTVAC